jgi:hypothetical protein
VKVQRYGNRTRIIINEMRMDNRNYKWNISKKSLLNSNVDETPAETDLHGPASTMPTAKNNEYNLPSHESSREIVMRSMDSSRDASQLVLKYFNTSSEVEGLKRKALSELTGTHTKQSDKITVKC